MHIQYDWNEVSIIKMKWKGLWLKIDPYVVYINDVSGIETLYVNL